MEPMYHATQIPTYTGEDNWIWVMIDTKGNVTASSRHTFLSKKECEDHIVFMARNMQLKKDDSNFVWFIPDIRRTLKKRLSRNPDDDVVTFFRDICSLVESHLRLLYEDQTGKDGSKKDIITLHNALMSKGYRYHSDIETHRSIIEAIKKVAKHRNPPIHENKTELSYNEVEEIATILMDLPVNVIGLSVQGEHLQLA